MDKKYDIITGEDDEFGTEIYPEYDELYSVLTRSDEKDRKRKSISKGERCLAKTKRT